MLISSFYYSTGSFFHYDGKEDIHKVAKHVRLIIASLLIETVGFLGLTSIGLLAFSSLGPHALQNLPLAAKVVMLSSGFLMLVINLTYTFYRLKKLKGETNKDLLKTENTIHKEKGILEEKVTKETAKATAYLQYLDEREKEIDQALKDIKKRISALPKDLEDSLQYAPPNEEPKPIRVLIEKLENLLKEVINEKERVTKAAEEIDLIREQQIRELDQVLKMVSDFKKMS